jgi:hypothetical protein
VAVFDILIAGTATVHIEQKIDGGSAFYTVGNRTASGLLPLGSLVGTYRANVTACTGCTVSVSYHFTRQ